MTVDISVTIDVTPALRIGSDRVGSDRNGFFCFVAVCVCLFSRWLVVSVTPPPPIFSALPRSTNLNSVRTRHRQTNRSAWLLPRRRGRAQFFIFFFFLLLEIIELSESATQSSTIIALYRV